MWVAKRIAHLLDVEVGPDCPVASREMGQSGPDIRLVGEARKLFPFYVECKNQERWSIPAWVDDLRKKTSGPMWLLFVSRNRFGRPVVVMDAEVFFEICEMAKEQKTSGFLQRLLWSFPGIRKNYKAEGHEE